MSEYVRLRLRPVTFAEARRYVAEVHRHNDPPVGYRVAVGIEDADGNLRGVGILGIPKARMTMQEGRTAEVIRVATDGVKNGCSMLYGALVRAAWALGYDRIVTYTLAEEGGASLRAAGWRNDGKAGGGDWTVHPSVVRSHQRPTLFFDAKVPTGEKVRWVIERKAA
jgi:hypothetical protein